MDAVALIDGNNFYASCEQSINPSLRNKPLVILSNNDGCVIARSAEAHNLKIKMGEPYFKIKSRLKKLGVIVLSSNYSLYGNMSKRLMNLLRNYCEKIEIYSIDEAFISISRPNNKDLYPWARALRALIYQNLGIAITIGIGENKLSSKLANKLAKKINSSAGIFDIANVSNRNSYLKEIKVDHIWGIGNQTSKWLRSKGIKNAKELKDMNPYELKKKLGVVGERIQLELKGCLCLPIEEKKRAKKEIRISRSFSQPITQLKDLQHALAIYAIRASEKMRIENLQASAITIFTRNSHYSDFIYQKSAYKKLNEATNDTNIILKIVIELSNQIYHPEYKLAKAGVLMQDLSDFKYFQKSIINYSSKNKSTKERPLIKTIDSLNHKFKNEVITWGIAKRKQSWSMNRKLLSGISITNIDKIPTIII